MTLACKTNYRKGGSVGGDMPKNVKALPKPPVKPKPVGKPKR